MSVKSGSGKSGSGKTIALLILVVAAIGLVGYYGFVETGVGKDKATPARSIASPSPSPLATPAETPTPVPTQSV